MISPEILAEGMTAAIKLELRKFSTRKVVSGLELAHLAQHDPQISVRLCEWADELILQLWTYIGTQEIGEVTHSQSTEVPANWWECFKNELFPMWLLARFPVKTKSITLTVTCKAWIPYLEIPKPKSGPIRFAVEHANLEIY